MKQAGKRKRTIDPEQARKRRMSSYPQDYFNILTAINQRRDWTKVFEMHRDAGAFQARWYRFRFDAMESYVPGALDLRETKVTGVNGDGTPFNTGDKFAPGPFTLTWRYMGSAEDEAMAARLEAEQQHFRQPAQADKPTENKPTESELAVAAAVSSLQQPTAPARLAEDWMEQYLAQKLGKVSGHGTVTSCQHEADATGCFCLKCELPTVEWK